MDLSNITTVAVEASLKAVRAGKPPDSNLLLINWSGSSNREENILALENLLQDLICRSYTELRQGVERTLALPDTRQALLNQVQDDFNASNNHLEAWSALYSRYISTQDISMEDLARAANVVPQQFRKRLRLGLALLVQKLQREASKIEARSQGTHPDLPLPDYTRLIGHQQYSNELLELFSDASGPGIVSLEGMGGIGKSAVARYFVSTPQVIQQWQTIVWVSARQSILSENGQVTAVLDAIATLEDISIRLCDQLSLFSLASKALPERLEGLRGVLLQQPHLIVVDNLETVEEYRQLIPALAKMAGKSRFLITSRQTLRDFGYVHTIPVKEMDEYTAYELMQGEIARRGRSISIADASFSALYGLIGGLPLAIKFVAAQLNLLPLSTILDGFRTAQGSSDGLYHYLYWQTWNALSNPSRSLLLSFLPADPEGEDLDFLREMSGLPDEVFFEALRGLDQFSLLEFVGEAEHPRYRLHRLTVTFLQTDILKIWSNPSADTSLDST
jgi:hypothetical protein